MVYVYVYTILFPFLHTCKQIMDFLCNDMRQETHIHTNDEPTSVFSTRMWWFLHVRMWFVLTEHISQSFVGERGVLVKIYRFENSSKQFDMKEKHYTHVWTVAKSWWFFDNNNNKSATNIARKYFVRLGSVEN